MTEYSFTALALLLFVVPLLLGIAFGGKGWAVWYAFLFAVLGFFCAWVALTLHVLQ